MKILAVADEECKALWDYFTPDKLEGVELIIACGDLSRHYLEYLATMAPVPLLYVHGNHDESYDTRPPQGVICLDDDVYVHNGLRIAGLGGSCRYRTGAWQFTEAEMKKRINRLRGKIDRHGGIDILVTHAPLHGYGDMTDLPHRGFTVFSVLLDRYHPQLMLHGHIHLNYGCSIPREQQYGATRIVNCYERVYLDVDAPGCLLRCWDGMPCRGEACLALGLPVGILLPFTLRAGHVRPLPSGTANFIKQGEPFP